MSFDRSLYLKYKDLKGTHDADLMSSSDQEGIITFLTARNISLGRLRLDQFNYADLNADVLKKIHSGLFYNLVSLDF